MSIIGLNPALVKAGTSTAGRGAEYKLGSLWKGSDGTEWQYCQATEAITQYMAVAVDEAGQASKLTSALALVGYSIGVAQVAFAQYDFGWICTDAANTNDKKVYVLSACDSDVDLNTSGTAGALDDAYTTFVPLVGIMITTTLAATGGATAIFNGRVQIGLRTSGV